MDISVADLVSKIKEVFDSTKVLSVESVYEKVENSSDLRLVISMNKILYDDVNIILKGGHVSGYEEFESTLLNMLELSKKLKKKKLVVTILLILR